MFTDIRELGDLVHDHFEWTAQREFVDITAARIYKPPGTLRFQQSCTPWE